MNRRPALFFLFLSLTLGFLPFLLLGVSGNGSSGQAALVPTTIGAAENVASVLSTDSILGGIKAKLLPILEEINNRILAATGVDAREVLRGLVNVLDTIGRVATDVMRAILQRFGMGSG